MFSSGGNSHGVEREPGSILPRSNGFDRKRKHASPPHMMPTIIPAEGDNLTHSTHTHRSEDGSLTPNYVNRYSIGKGAKKVKSRTKLP